MHVTSFDFANFARSITAITVFMTMFALGLSQTLEQVISLWKQPGLLLRSFLAINILVPLVSFIAIRIFALPVAVSVGILLLAASPAAPLAVRLAAKAGGNITYTVSLVVTIGILAVITTPLIIQITIAGTKVSVIEIAKLIIFNQLVPLALGLIVRWNWISLASMIHEPITKIAGALFPTLLVLIIAQNLTILLSINLIALLAMLLINIAAVGCGHLLGGPGLEQRGTLGIFTAFHNSALALLVATTNFTNSIPTIVAYSIVSMVVCAVYASILHQQHEASEKRQVKTAVG